MKTRILGLTAVAALMLGIATPAAAQAPLDERFLVRISPIALMYANLKLGAEYMVTPNVAVDANLTHTRNFFFTDITYSSAMVGARYYPTAPFQGFSVAGHLGGVRFAAPEQDSESFPLIHMELAYSWLLGESQRFYVAPALGAMRLFTSGTIEGGEGEEDFTWEANIPIPTWRLQVGYRF